MLINVKQDTVNWEVVGFLLEKKNTDLLQIVSRFCDTSMLYFAGSVGLF